MRLLGFWESGPRRDSGQVGAFLHVECQPCGPLCLAGRGDGYRVEDPVRGRLGACLVLIGHESPSLSQAQRLPAGRGANHCGHPDGKVPSGVGGERDPVADERDRWRLRHCGCVRPDCAWLPPTPSRGGAMRDRLNPPRWRTHRLILDTRTVQPFREKAVRNPFCWQRPQRSYWGRSRTCGWRSLCPDSRDGSSSASARKHRRSLRWGRGLRSNRVRERRRAAPATGKP